QQQAHFGVIAAVVDEVGTRGLELGDHGGIVAVAGVDAFEQDDLDAGLFEIGLDSRGNALAVRLLVVEHGHGLGLDLLGDEFRGGGTLLVVAADGAEDHVVVLAVGHQGRGGGRGDHDHAFVVVDGRCGDRGTGAHVAHDVVDLFSDDAVGHDRTFLGLASVFDLDGVVLADHHATTSIDGFDCRDYTLLAHDA